MTGESKDTLRQEANHWFARRLDPAVREKEGEAFELWQQADPRAPKAYAEAERLWNRLAILKQSDRLRGALQDSAPAGGILAHAWRQPLVRYPAFVALAAGLAAVAVLAVDTLSHTHTAPTQIFATALGEQRTERLIDGTTLRLNTESVVQVRMTRRRREVTLLSGEAVFEVAKDASRPFVVTAGDGTVTAVGTEFEVRNIGGSVAVTLMEGRVWVARLSRREVESLDPGQQASYSKDSSGIVTRNVDVEALTSWMSGRLEFRATPLDEAVAEANRYSAKKIRIADPAIAGLAVSGTFRAGDVEGMASAFEAAFPVRVEATQNEVVLTGR